VILAGCRVSKEFLVSRASQTAVQDQAVRKPELPFLHQQERVSSPRTNEAAGLLNLREELLPPRMFQRVRRIGNTHFLQSDLLFGLAPRTASQLHRGNRCLLGSRVVSPLYYLRQGGSPAHHTGKRRRFSRCLLGFGWRKCLTRAGTAQKFAGRGFGREAWLRLR